MKKFTGMFAVGLCTVVASSAFAQEITEERVIEINEAASKKTVAKAKAAAKAAAKAEVEAALKKAAEEPALEYQGYFRSGGGINSQGTAMQAFHLGNRYAWGGTKYRLGNESDTYAEMVLKANWYTPDPTDKGKMSSVIRLGFWNQNGMDMDNWHFYVPEIYVISENILKDGMNLWIGKRFYRRMDVHINDYFFFNTASYGGGVENFELMPGGPRLSLALLGTTPAVNPGNQAMKSTVDLQVDKIAIGPGELQVRLNFAYINRVEGVTGSEDVSGLLGALIYDTAMMNGSNRFAAIFGNGAMVNFTSDFLTGLKEMPSGSDPAGFTTSDAWRLAFLDYFTIAPSDKFDMMFLANYEMGEIGTASDPGFMTISAGARPVFHLAPHVSLAVELGVDYMDKKYNDSKGFLGKLTIAPQVYAGEGFWGRPVLRVFATAATWSEDLKGSIGGSAFSDDTFGMNFGLQAETWW